MKKIYLGLSLLLSAIGTTTTSAENVVASLGDPVTSLANLTEGTQVVFYNSGRGGYLRENTDLQLQLTPSIEFGQVSSAAYLFTVTNVSNDANGNLVAQFRSNTGNYIPVLPTTEAVSTSATADNFTVTVSGNGSDLWNLLGTNNNYFNGNDIVNGTGTFTGWSTEGGNSDYRIYLPTIEDVTTASVTLSFYDTDFANLQDDQVLTIALGSAIEEAPAIEHYDFIEALNSNNDPVEFPYTVEGDEQLLLTYEQWPLVTVTCLDEAGNTLQTTTEYLQKGTTLTIPEFIGYTLVTTGYEDYTVTESADITLQYEASDNLPFKPTTITDGAFAEDTQWYLIRLNNQFYFQYQPLATNGYEFCTTLDEAADSLLWCMTGNTIDGFKLYNKAAGATKVLALNSATSQSYPMLVEESTEPAYSTFDLLANDPGYALRIKGTENACLNNFGALGTLSVWDSSYASSDPGSRIQFIIDDPEARLLAPYAPYLNAENCVGGWSTANLAALRTAYEAKDAEACATAVAALAEADTIAFDPNQAYEIISAFEGFATEQPGKTFAIYATNDATNGECLAWKELDSDDLSFRFYFTEGSEEGTWNLGSYAAVVNEGVEKFMKTYRWAQVAPLGTDEPADIKMVKSEIEPAAYLLIHPFMEGSNPDKVTLDCFNSAGNASAESGFIKTYNTPGKGNANTWRLRPVGELTGIGSAITDSETTVGTKNDVIYDLTGRRVVKPSTGIYIINGKKVYVK